MMFKKPKDQLLGDIYNNCHHTVHSQLYSHYGEVGLNAEILSSTIAMAIEEAFRTMIENQYTDDDFEKDIGLKT